MSTLPRFAAYFKKFDWLLFGSSAALAVFGLVVLYSTSLGAAAVGLPGAGQPPPVIGDFGNFWKQVIFAAAGAVIALALPAFNYRLLSGLAKALYALSLVLLVAVLIFGRSIRGTTGWFGIGGFGIQPVELVKLLLIVFLAKFFSDYARDRKTIKPIVGSGLAFAAVFLLVLKQPDFGSALLLFAVWLTMLLLAGVRRSHLAAILIVGAAAAAVAWFFLMPYQRDRLKDFIDPGADPRGRGYNVTQSIIAIGSGGLTGKGLGYGSQSQLRFLPERQTDFVFAAAAEELGFLGAAFMFILFGVFFFQGFLLTRAVRDDFTLFLVLGILTSLAVEFVINIGGNLRLLPVTGVTLPFLSYGGSSLLVKFLMVGVLESIAVRR